MGSLHELEQKILRYEQREQELTRLLDHLNDFTENASTPMHWVGPDGYIIWANRAELNMLGYSRNEYVGCQMVDFYDDPLVFDELFGQLSRNEPVIDFPAELKCKDGSVKKVLINSSVYRVDGEFVHTRCMTTDLSSKAYEEITKSERLFRAIALNIPQSLIMVVDPDHKFLLVEGDLAKKFGYDSRSFEGRHAAEVLPGDRYEMTKGLFDRALKGEKFSVDRRLDSGEDFIVHMAPLRDDSGNVYAALIIALDVTDIRKAEKEAAQLAAIVQSSDDAIISKTLNSIITSWNQAAQRLFGWTAEEIIGQSILVLIPEDRQDEEPMILARLHKGERVEHFETKRITKDRKIIDLSLTISPVKDNNGNIIGLSKIARDITHKKQEETRKNDFIAIISHELKTPLTSIKSYIQILLTKAINEDNDFSANALRRAEVQTNKMTHMINDFLSMARLEEGKIRLHKEPFHLHELLEELASDAQFLSAGHRVILKDCEEIVVKADRDKISQILINLLSNAIKYSSKGTTVTMGCRTEGDRVRVYVTDEGVGISSDDQKQLFQRFHRIQNDKLKTVSGFGIGLYIVAELLRSHHSKIEVQSREGEGSTFSFTLKSYKEAR